MLEAYGEVPLHEHHGLGISVMSYDGRLFFGLNADYDVMRDLDRYVLALRQSFSDLVDAADAAPPMAETDAERDDEVRGGGGREEEQAADEA